MNLSVFNLLMSTTPTISGTETPFSGQAETNAAAQAAQMQESMKTGEAFLKVLEQVRAGKTEKSAETLFNTMSARADASSSLKNFKTNEKTGEEVKIVRLHIKRTRASEKLQKAEENTPATAETAQNRQKIPDGENIAAAQQTQSAVPQENTVRENTDQTADPIPAASDQTKKPSQNDFIFSDELTAADILVGAALQANTVHADAGQNRPVDTAQPLVDGTERQPLPDVREDTIPTQVDHDTAKAPLPAIQPVRTEQNSVPVKQNISLPQNAENLPLPAGLKTDTAVPVIQTEKPEQNDGFVLIKETELPENVSAPAKETLRTAPAQEKKVLNERSPIPQAAAESAETAAGTEDILTLPQKESRRQADQLAAGLPADVKIAVTVETNKPAAAVFRPVSPAGEKNTAEKRITAEKDQETALFTPSDTALPEKEEAPRAVETKTISGNSDRPQAAKQQIQDTMPQFTALPVEQKSLPSAVQTSAGTQTTAGAVNTNTPNTQAGQAFIPAGQELKGKAVSGTAALPKHVPVNELADQIKVNIKKALKAGLDKIDVVLKHKELGTIKVHLEIDKDGNMKAVLSTARTETLDLLRADLQGLKQALSDSGFNMNDEAFSFNYRGERYDGGREQNEQRHNGSTASDEEEEIPSRPAPSTADYSGRYALNIRV